MRACIAAVKTVRNFFMLPVALLTLCKAVAQVGFSMHGGGSTPEESARRRLHVPCVFFQFAKIMKKDDKIRNVKILVDVSLFAASRTATKSDPESAMPYVLRNSQNF